ncbi:MAG: hypothetical protein KAH01_05235 [Caldisericia bacterium]|nr:hypothetical protein [Caldisericia bacterium]
MEKHKYFNKSYIGMICFLIVFCLIGCNIPTQERINVNIENKGLVEVYIYSQFAPHKTNFPLNKLEADDPSLSSICYDLFEEDSNYTSYTPHPYGYMHYKKIEPCLDIQMEGIPRTIYQRQSSSVGRPQESWIENIKRVMEQKIVEKKIENVSFQLLCNDDNSYQVSVSFKWIESMTQKELEGLRYNLFLKADKLYWLNEYDNDFFADNIAYDFIPLIGDKVKEYDGVEFPLFDSVENYLTEENNFTLTITTESFTLPQIEGLTKEQQPKWSLHLILNNNKNLCKNLYSWSYQLPSE